MDTRLRELIELAAARDQLLGRVVQVLEDDARINAAWLSGSYGRGETDEWSDLDLHVAVADEHLEAVLGEHKAIFAACGEQAHVISHGIPSWSMPNGRFWLVQYAPCMLEIDWNIGPTAGTTIPEASHILFDRVNIPITPPIAPPSQEFRRTEAQKHLEFFWAMAPIAVKFVGRGHTRLAVHQVQHLSGALLALWHALYHPELLQKDTYHQNRPLVAAMMEKESLRFDPVISPLGALAVIRAHCAEVEQLHPALAELGATVDERVVRETYALAEVAEAVARLGGSNPYGGSRR